MLYESTSPLLHRYLAAQSGAVQKAGRAVFLVVALGEHTASRSVRVNVCRTYLKRAVRTLGGQFREDELPNADVAEVAMDFGGYSRAQVLFVLPCTPFESSGSVVRRALCQYRVPETRLLVLRPDFRVPIGKMVTHFRGTASHHLGLQDVAEVIHCNDYVALCVGINGVHSPGSIDSEAYFLRTKFAAKEQLVIDARLEDRILTIVRCFCDGSLLRPPPYFVRWHRDDYYVCGEQVGEGRFGAVFKCVDTRDNSQVCSFRNVRPVNGWL